MRQKMKRVLFLCTGNSCRSQMAEGWARHFFKNSVEVFSAGSRASGLNPKAVRVMAEAGVDISSQRSKVTDELPSVPFDLVVTLCESAREACPYFPGPGMRMHRGFDDPPFLEASAKTPEGALDIYRRVRDEIRDFIKTLPDILLEDSE